MSDDLTETLRAKLRGKSTATARLRDQIAERRRREETATEQAEADRDHLTGSRPAGGDGLGPLLRRDLEARKIRPPVRGFQGGDDAA